MTQSVRERAITFASENPTSVASGYILTLADDLSKAVEALKPFVETLENDVSESEHDDDIFMQSRSGYNRAPLITIADLRRAREAYNHLTRDKG